MSQNGEQNNDLTQAVNTIRQPQSPTVLESPLLKTSSLVNSNIGIFGSKIKGQTPANDLLKSVLEVVQKKSLKEILQKSQLQTNELPKSVLQRSKLNQSITLNILLQGVYETMVNNQLNQVNRTNSVGGDVSLVNQSARNVFHTSIESGPVDVATKRKSAGFTEINQSDQFINTRPPTSKERQKVVERVTEDIATKMAEMAPGEEYNLTISELRNDENKAVLEEICDNLIQKVLNQEEFVDYQQPKETPLIPVQNDTVLTTPSEQQLPLESKITFRDTELTAEPQTKPEEVPKPPSWESFRDETKTPLAFEIKLNVSQKVAPPSALTNSSKSIKLDEQRQRDASLSPDKSSIRNSSISSIYPNKQPISHCEQDRETISKLNAELVSLRERLDNQSEGATDSLFLIRDLKNQLEIQHENHLKELESASVEVNHYKSELEKKRYECENQRLNMQQLNNELKRTRAMNALLNGDKRQNEDLRRKFERTFQEKEASLKAKEKELQLSVERSEKFVMFLMRKLEQTGMHKELLTKLQQKDYVKLIEANYESLADTELAGFIWEGAEQETVESNDINNTRSAMNYSMGEFMNTTGKTAADAVVLAKQYAQTQKTDLKPQVKLDGLNHSPVALESSQENIKLASPSKASLPSNPLSNDFSVTSNRNPQTFGTNRDEIKKNLDSILKEKLNFKTGGYLKGMTGLPHSAVPPKIEATESNLSHDSQTPIQSEKRFTINSIRAVFTEPVYLELMKEIESFLDSPKNETTFRMSDFEKKVLRVKFKSDKEQTVRKVVIRFLKVFVRNINFLECQINKLVKGNSDLELKNQKLKTENESILHKYLETNQQTQLAINQANEQVMKFKTNTSGTKPSSKVISVGKLGKEK